MYNGKSYDLYNLLEHVNIIDDRLATTLIPNHVYSYIYT